MPDDIKYRNIVLTGMPGAGKSTMGVLLAKYMGYEFMDADLQIQKSENRLLREIISDCGIDGFIKIEEKVNASINVKKTVIATGGSVIYGAKAMEHYKESGVIVYLKLSYNTIKRRLGNLKQRGDVLRQGQTLRDIYNDRTPFYEKYADIIVECDGYGISQLAMYLETKLRDYMCLRDTDN